MKASQEIKDRLKIEDVVSQYVQLKKAGRSMKGLCPFHAEKTPSFVVSPDRQIAYCFGCHKGGDVFTFIQEVEGVDFPDALKLLAERAGVTLEESYSPTRKRKTGSQKEVMLKVYEKVTKIYERNLWKTENGKKVLEYLRKRGLTDDSIRQFRIGFSEDSFDATYKELLNGDFTKQLLVEAGLAMTKETTTEKIYDRFRGRLMFPIRDHLGRVVAFGGRALKKDQEPKYLNSPETSLYHKSKVLYGFYQAKNGIKERNEVVLVEGYTDVILSHQIGATNVVAPCGTAITSQQIRLLKPFVQTLVLAFDNDLAGREAARRAFEQAQEFDLAVKVLPLVDDKDPAEYIKAHGEDFVKLVEKSRPYGDFLFDYLKEAYGVEDSAAKRKVVQEFLPFFHTLTNTIMKDEYVRRLAYELGLKEVQIYDEIGKFKLPSDHPARLQSSLNESAKKVPAKKYAEEVLLGLMIEYPRIGALYVEKLQEMALPDDLKAIYKALADQYNVEGLKTAQDVMDQFPHDLKEKAALLSLAIEESYGEIGEEDVEKEIAALLRTALKRSQAGQKEVLWRELKKAEGENNAERRAQILNELNELNRNLA